VRSIKIAAAVAAVAALATAGVAEGQRLITGALIKNNTITGKDVKNGSLTLQDFKGSSIRGRRGPQGPQGVPGIPGAAGVPGAPGAKGTTDIVYVDGEVVSVPPNESRTALALCPPGSSATGGAWFAPLLVVDEFTALGPGGFGVSVFNPQTVPLDARATAACARR
jgi:hypothetical protein